MLTQSGKAESLLNESRAATARLQSLQANLEGAPATSSRYVGHVLLKRPNLARIVVKGEDGYGGFVTVSDGKNLFDHSPGRQNHPPLRARPDRRNINTTLAEPVRHFFAPETIGVVPKGYRAIYAGAQTMDGMPYEVVEIVAPSSRRWSQTTRYFISPKDHLIHRMAVVTKYHNGKTETAWTHLKNVKTNVPADNSAFRWTPPEKKK
jgi:outer membrane lipoprotein-sorting protein